MKKNPIDMARDFLTQVLGGPQTFKFGKQPVSNAAAIPPQPKQSLIQQQPQQPYVAKIQVPTGQGNQTLNPQMSQMLLNNFNDIGEATNSARVLLHPNQQTRTQGELNKGLGTSFNRGENPEFKMSNIDVPNNDGSIDRGLFRINSNTFTEMIKDKFWGSVMKNSGIKSWSDMDNVDKNTRMARLILARANWDSQNNQIMQNPNWSQWYAAPLDLRTR